MRVNNLIQLTSANSLRAVKACCSTMIQLLVSNPENKDDMFERK